MLPASLVSMLVLIKTRRIKNRRRYDATRVPSLQFQCDPPGECGRARRLGTTSRAARESLPEDLGGFRPSGGTACTASSLRAGPRRHGAAVREAISRAR